MPSEDNHVTADDSDTNQSPSRAACSREKEGEGERARTWICINEVSGESEVGHNARWIVSSTLSGFISAFSEGKGLAKIEEKLKHSLEKFAAEVECLLRKEVAGLIMVGASNKVASR